MRLAGPIALFLIGKALLAGPAPKVSTAVFTLDAEQRLLLVTPDNPLEDQLTRWASQCRIEPGDIERGGAVAVFVCSAQEQAPEPKPDEPSEKIPATLALFRDLDETVYLAGCPLEEETGAESGAQAAAKAEPEKVNAEDARNCRDIAAGQTFSAEWEDDQLRLVVRGRQLAMKVFEVREKPKTTSTPYVPSPSQRMAPTGPATTASRKGLEPQSEPQWEPPQPAAASAGRPSQPAVSDVEPARTSLRTGRLTVQCPSREFAILIDGAYMGACPITTTLIAGPHTVTIRRPGKEDETQQIRVEAGKTFRLRTKG